MDAEERPFSDGFWGGTNVLFTVAFRGFLRYFAGVEIFY